MFSEYFQDACDYGGLDRSAYARELLVLARGAHEKVGACALHGQERGRAAAPARCGQAVSAGATGVGAARSVDRVGVDLEPGA